MVIIPPKRYNRFDYLNGIRTPRIGDQQAHTGDNTRDCMGGRSAGWRVAPDLKRYFGILSRVLMIQIDGNRVQNR